MQVKYSVRGPEALDRIVHEAYAERPDKPVRIRLQPVVYRLDARGGHAKAMYRSWPDVHWLVECDTAAEAVALRETLKLFFEVLGTAGCEGVRQVLSPVR